MAKRIAFAFVSLMILVVSMNTMGYANNAADRSGEVADSRMDGPPNFPPPPPWP
jgi:hypothetical protein